MHETSSPRPSFALAAAVLAVAIAGCTPPGNKPVGSFGLSSVPVAAAKGQAAGRLRVDFGSLVKAAYRVQAVRADVAKVTIAVKQGAALVATAEVLQEELSSGATSHEFTGLAFGSYEVVVTAWGAASQVLGTTTRTADVASTTPVIVPITVQLAPTVGPAVSVPDEPTSGGGGSSGGGGTGGGTGTIDAQVVIRDGYALTHLDNANLSEATATGNRLYRDPGTGTLWTFFGSVASGGSAWAYGPDGASLMSAPALLSTLPALDSHGNLWAGDGYRIIKVAPNGTVTSPLGVPGLSELAGVNGLTVTGDDAVWANIQPTLNSPEDLVQLSADGRDVHGRGGSRRWLYPDHGTGCWAMQDNGFSHYGADGTLLGSIPWPADERGLVQDLVAAPDGSVWLLTDPDMMDTAARVYHFSAAGIQLGRYVSADAAFDIDLDKHGDCWVAEWTMLTKLGADAGVLGRYHVADDASVPAIAIDRAVNKAYLLDMAANRIRRTQTLP